MAEEIIKPGFERYLVVSLIDGAMVIHASSFIDVLAELRESDIDEDEIISIMKLDIEEVKEDDEEEDE